MKLKRTIRQLRLLAWVKEKHGDQKRKGGESYINHVVRVGYEAEDAGIEYGWEIGICHDLIEDTPVTIGMLKRELYILGYSINALKNIQSKVIELTDVYTHEDFPNINRAQRKILEAKRLWTISPPAQTIKYLDLIDNTGSIVKEEPKFASTYLNEKERILSKMTKGCRLRWKLAVEQLAKEQFKLKWNYYENEKN